MPASVGASSPTDNLEVDGDEDCETKERLLSEEEIPVSNSLSNLNKGNSPKELSGDISDDVSVPINLIDTNHESSAQQDGSHDLPTWAEGIPSGKDSRFSWVMITLVHLVNLILSGNYKSFGITYTIIMDYFPDASGAASGWILGLLTGCLGLFSPVMGALSVVIGPRRCVMLGGLMCSVSFLLSLPAISVEYMAFTLGALFGTGMCMTETPGYMIATDYFDKKQPIANGIRASGNSFGGFLLSPVIVILHQQFGFQGAFIMMSGIMLQIVVLGMLMRPFDQHKKLLRNEYIKTQLKNNPDLYSQIKQYTETQQREQKKGKKRKVLEFGFLKNPAYLVYLAVIFFSSAGMGTALFFLPVYGRTIGLTDMQNSMISSYFSLSDTVARIGTGWIFSYGIFKKSHGLIAGLISGAIGCLIVPLCSGFWHMLIIATLYAICTGSFFTLVNVLLADQFGGDSMPSTWGFFRMSQGMWSFMFPPFLGWVMDVSGGPEMPFIVMGCLYIISALIFALRPLIARLTGSSLVVT